MRYAVIIKSTGEVSSIQNMEGDSEPIIREVHKYDVAVIDDTVQVGMSRDGVGGYAFPNQRPKLVAVAPDVVETPTVQPIDGPSQITEING